MSRSMFKRKSGSGRGPAWSEQERKLLVDQILKTVSEGGKQATALELVAKTLNRTVGACAFQWHFHLRDTYLEELNQANIKGGKLRSTSKRAAAVAQSPKDRVNGWTTEQETKLAEIVLQTVANGGTQLMGFEAATQELKRTKAACAYRWNCTLRNQYKQELREAKRKRLALRAKRLAETA